MIKFRMFALLAGSLLLAGCWVEDDSDLNAECTSDCTIIEGRFTTEDGTVPIAGVQLEFNWSIRGTAGLTGVTRRIATGRTDEDGYYRISFYAEDRELTEGRYSIKFQVPGDSYIDLSHNYFGLYGIDQRDTVVTQNYHIPRKGAAIQVRITNPEEIPEGDKLNCTVSYKVGDLAKNIRRANSLFSQYASEATFPTAALQYTYLKVTRVENGEASFYLDSLIIDAGETRLYDISY